MRSVSVVCAVSFSNREQTCYGFSDSSRITFLLATWTKFSSQNYCMKHLTVNVMEVKVANIALECPFVAKHNSTVLLNSQRSYKLEDGAQEKFCRLTCNNRRVGGQSGIFKLGGRK